MSRKTAGDVCPGCRTLMMPACSTMNNRSLPSRALVTKIGPLRPDSTGTSVIEAAASREAANAPMATMTASPRAASVRLVVRALHQQWVAGRFGDLAPGVVAGHGVMHIDGQGRAEPEVRI